MNPKEALKVLDQATQPNNKLTRADYVTVHQALLVLDNLVNPKVDDPPDEYKKLSQEASPKANK